MLLSSSEGNQVRLRYGTAFAYVAAAVTTANWIDYAMWPEQPYGHQILLRISFVGSGLFGIGCLVSLFRFRSASIFGMAGACFSWPYFSILAADMPWSKFVWLVTVHDHGAAQVMSIFFLTMATVFSLIGMWGWVRSRRHLVQQTSTANS